MHLELPKCSEVDISQLDKCNILVHSISNANKKRFPSSLFSVRIFVILPK